MELRIGDYVRTKYYGISKTLNISNETTSNYCSLKLDRIDDFGSLGVYVSKENIIKSSPNIIDLIEVGDYVDRLRVVDKEDNYIVVETFDERIIITKEDNIKSILTKEQFESMEYKVKE